MARGYQGIHVRGCYGWNGVTKRLTKKGKALDNARDRARRAAWKAAGLCSICGGPRKNLKFKKCWYCRIKHAMYRQNRRQAA
jgi:hypothetical protein